MIMNVDKLVYMIKETALVNITIFVPSFANQRIFLTINCLSSGQQFSSISSLNLLQVGRNIDGFVSEHLKGDLVEKTSTNATNARFYNDTLVIDLGVVTNTSKPYLLHFFFNKISKNYSNLI
jgi:hypothetical protein